MKPFQFEIGPAQFGGSYLLSADAYVAEAIKLNFFSIANQHIAW